MLRDTEPLPSSTNEAYRRRYEDDGQQLRDEYREVRRQANLDWDARIASERKKRKLKKKDELPQEFIEDLRHELYAKYKIPHWEERVDQAQKEREAKLTELAEQVDFHEDPTAMYAVKTSSTRSYSSQGYGASRYAKGVLIPLKEKLESLGISTHITRVKETYILWAACPEWVADAADRLITIKEWLAANERAGCNSRVYNPFLPWSVV